MSMAYMFLVCMDKHQDEGKYEIEIIVLLFAFNEVT